MSQPPGGQKRASHTRIQFTVMGQGSTLGIKPQRGMINHVKLMKTSSWSTRLQKVSIIQNRQKCCSQCTSAQHCTCFLTSKEHTIYFKRKNPIWVWVSSQNCVYGVWRWVSHQDCYGGLLNQKKTVFAVFLSELLKCFYVLHILVSIFLWWWGRHIPMSHIYSEREKEVTELLNIICLKALFNLFGNKYLLKCFRFIAYCAFYYC